MASTFNVSHFTTIKTLAPDQNKVLALREKYPVPKQTHLLDQTQN